MSEELATNPVAEAANAAPEAPEVAPEAPETDLPEGEQPEAPVDDSEEIDHEGQKYRIPKALKDAFLRQADYTRKTQEVAEQRRALEAQHAQFQQAAQMQQAYLEDIADLRATDKQLEAFAKVDWNALNSQDPVQAQNLWFQYQQLKDGRAAIVQKLQQKDQQRAIDAQRATARQIEEAEAILRRDIPEWSPELKGKLRDYAVSRGIPAEQLAGITNPAVVKILHEAYVGRQLIEKQRAAAKAPTPVANPVPTVSARSAPAAVNPLSDKADIETWIKARNAQVAKRGR